MHDDRASRALSAGFFEFVCPATIIGHGFAFEEFIAAGIAWVIDQHDDCFAFNIEPGIIVPAIFRGNDAIANEDQFRVLPAGFIAVLLLGPHDRVFAQCQRIGLARRAARHGELRGIFVEALLNHANGLEPSAILARRLQADTFHFRGEPISCFLTLLSRWCATFKGIIGEDGDALTQIIGADRCGRVCRQR